MTSAATTARATPSAAAYHGFQPRSWRVRAVAYAPRPKKIECPNESCPLRPPTRLYAVAAPANRRVSTAIDRNDWVEMSQYGSEATTARNPMIWRQREIGRAHV